MKKRRFQYDSTGKRAEIILFSELNIPSNISNPTPEDMLGGAIDLLPDIGFGETNRFTEEEQVETVNALRVAFTLLTEKQRAVIYKKFYQNKNGQAIARELNISPAATYRLIDRAIKDLQKLMLKKKQEKEQKPEKSGKMLDIDQLLMALKESVFTSSYIRVQNKTEIYKLIDRIDNIVVSKQREKKPIKL